MAPSGAAGPASASPGKRTLTEDIVGSITGPEARDLRVVHELVRLNGIWGTVLQHRDPGGFAD